MVISLRHAFTSPKVDGADSTLVQPSNWNAEHVLTMASGFLVGRSTAGNGPAQEIVVGSGLVFSGGSLSLANSVSVTALTLGGSDLQALLNAKAPVASPSFTGSVTSAGSFLAAVGSAASPTYTWTGESGTGVFRPASGTVAVATGGSERFRFGGSGQLGIGGANFGSSGQLLVSGGGAAPPSWTSLGALIGGMSEDSVGSFAFAALQTGTANFGATVAGADLRPAGVSGSAVVTGASALTGTWRCLGQITAAGQASLFMRVS